MSVNYEGFIRTSLGDSEDTLISAHYLNEVLPTTNEYLHFDYSKFVELINNEARPLKRIMDASKELNERQIEDAIIRPVLESLDNTLRAQVAIGSDSMDFCTYTPDKNIEPDGFAADYSNIGTIVESKRYGRIENRYYIHKEDNTDEIYQTLNYLRTVNLTLNNTNSTHDVNNAILTDGYLWRIYSKSYTHNLREYESHFIEFDLYAILGDSDLNRRNHFLKVFAMMFSATALSGGLRYYQNESEELEVKVSTALREQTFTALEYIATGLWREIAQNDNPLLANIIDTQYGIDVEVINDNHSERAKLLKLVYDESIVFLLRLLFVLYAEDRNLFDQTLIPKVVKGNNNILSLILSKGKGIGEIEYTDEFERNDDLRLSKIFSAIDKKYNGGLFSSKKHPILHNLNMDDILFVNAIDNLCRVQINKKVYTVDFSSISVRELGGIYESLLEYKLAIVECDKEELPSIVNKKRVRYNVKKGDLYLINHDGERKATGSYFTPDLIVEHLVKKNLDPMLIKAKDECGNSFSTFLKSVFDIKICDPAMGFGHMIQACFSHIISFVRQTLEEFNAEGYINKVWDDDFAYYVRTQVARKCIYGVDLNPIAVELAKLVIWMKVFRKDKPFEFLDYNIVCGNSLIGVYDDVEASDLKMQLTLFRSKEDVESDIQAKLLHNVSVMMDMPRNTVDEIHSVEAFWKNEVKALQQQVSFLYNIKLAIILLPEKEEAIKAGYEDLLHGIEADNNYVNRIINNDESIPIEVRNLQEIDSMVRSNYNPLHWKIAFPHISVKGGFDVIVSNPPWETVKSNHGEFFSDYIDGYSSMIASEAKKLAEEYLSNNPEIREEWNKYLDNIEKQNTFFRESYCYQTAEDSSGKTLKGDNNLYKVFLEKIETILAPNGNCGIVLPDNINIDNGCTGLRKLIIEKTTISELIMFINSKKLFDIHGQYKFDVLSFCKKKPRANASFDAGFYWYDPVWLDGNPDEDYISLDKRNQKKYHTLYKYKSELIKSVDSDHFTIFEFNNQKLMDVFLKMVDNPSIGDNREELYIKVRREFDMTNDSDLFRADGIGWPLMQGGSIHHFNSSYKSPEKYIISSDGEERLSKKWKTELKDLPDRKYRICWRTIAQPTDTRSLICTIIPRGRFTGNSLNFADTYIGSTNTDDSFILSGLNAIMSSMCADFYVRQRIAKNVNAFIVSSIPVPRRINELRELGEKAMPLYQGDEFLSLRGNALSIDDENERQRLIAWLDAKVAHLYKLTYEEYQAVLNSFSLVEEDFKNKCLLEYNNCMFDASK